MLGPSKQRIIVLRRTGHFLNSYPANETVNLTLNNSAISVALYAPLVLPQANVLVVPKNMSETRKNGFDLGLPKPQHLMQKEAEKQPFKDLEESGNLTGAGQTNNQKDISNLFLQPIKVTYFADISKINDFFSGFAH